jgi:membrane protein
VSESTVEPVRDSVLQRLIGAPLRFVRDWLAGFIGLQGFDRAVALAGQAFTALIPLLIVYSAVRSDASGRDFADELIKAFDLKGASADNVRQAFAPSSEVESSVSAFGALILIFSALSFTRALQRLYQLAWNQVSLGMRAAKWGLIWLAIVVITITLRPPLLSAVHGVTRVVVSIVVSGVVWLITPYILLGRRVPWRRLGPMAAMTGVGMTGLGLASAIWMPHSVAVSAGQFGTIGIAFALLSWLVGYGMVLVVTAAGGAVIDARLSDYRARRAARRAPHPPG